MSKRDFDLGDYNTVAERIEEFRASHPDGALQPVNPAQPYRVESIGDKTFIVYTAAAYRNERDKLPGIGCAWEPFPGKTPYTRDSELMNAETSAQGRAIVAALSADTRKGVASAEEVRNRHAEEDEPDPVAQLRSQVWRAANAIGLNTREAIEVDCKDTTGWDITQADQGQLESYLAGLKARADKPPDDKWYVRTEAEIAKPQTDDPLKSLKLQIWTAAKQAGLHTKEHLEQDFAQCTGGLILGEASEDELRSYLGLLKSRLENPQNDGPGAWIDEGEPL